MPRPERPVDPDGGPVQRLAFELRELRRGAGSPGYRELARVAHYSTTTLAQAARGDSLPSLAVTLAYVRACGGDAADWEKRWHATAAELGHPSENGSVDGRAPYVGLGAYEPSDAEWFHGRDRLVATLTETLARHRFVAVVGASGAGKSSLLRAGLVPTWPTNATMLLTPGAHPLEECAVHLGARLGLPPGVLSAEFAERPRNLGLAMRQVLATARPDGEFLLVVDQFEEIVTRCADEEERDRFVAALREAANGPDSRTRVVVGLRAEFARLAELPRDAQVSVGPMTAEELAQVVTEPAVHAGLMVEKSLVATVVSEAADRLGALPFVSQAMVETWRRRRGNGLFLAGYRAAGGVTGAIISAADRVSAELDREQWVITRNILVRLTAFGENADEDTRRRVPRSEFGADPGVARVLDRLAAARLVTLAEDTVEIAHEALVSGWPALRVWRTTDRKALRAHRRLTEAAVEWDRQGRDEGHLYRGSVLDAWQDREPGTLNEVEHAFLAASVRVRDRERTARRRRFRLSMAGLGVLGVVVGLLAVMVVIRNGAAHGERDLAYARQLAADAGNQLQFDTDLALRLAIEAAEVQPTEEVDAVLRQAVVDSRALATLQTHMGRVLGVAYSADGKRIAVTGDNGMVRVWEEPGPGRPWGRPVVLSGHHGEVWSPAFSSDGRYLATAGADASVRVWDLRDRKEYAVLQGPFSPGRNLAFSPDGSRLASTSFDGVLLWDVAGQRELQRFPGPAFGVAFSPDGRYLATSGHPGSAVLVRDLTGERGPVALGEQSSQQGRVAYSPDGQRLASTGDDGSVWLWDSTGGAVMRRGHVGQVLSLAFSSDGQTLAAAGQDGTIRLITTEKDGNPLVLRGHRGEVWGVAFSPNGRRLASVGIDGTLRVWRVAAPGDGFALRGHGGPVWSAVFTPDEKGVVSGSQDGTVRIWRTAGGEPVVLRGHWGEVLDVDVSPDGKRVASVGQDGVLRVWDAATGAVTREVSGAASSVAFTRDGSLVSSCAGVSVCVWPATPTEPPKMLAGYQGKIQQVAVSAELVAGSGDDGALRLWPGDGPTVLSGHNGPAYSIAFSADGRQVASGGHDSTVRIWRIDGGAGEPLVLRGHQGVVWSVAFSPDGRLLASSGNDGTLRIWRTNGAGDPVVFRGYQASVQSVAFSRDGRKLLTTHDDGTVRIQNCEVCGSTEEVLALARTRVSRPLTEDERRTFGVRD